MNKLLGINKKGVTTQDFDFDKAEQDLIDDLDAMYGTEVDELDDMDKAVAEPQPTNRPYLATPLTSAERLRLIGVKCGLKAEVADTFDPSKISWVAERIAITAEDGVQQALDEGHFVINVADEIENEAQVKIAVDVGTGTVLRSLMEIADTMETVFNTTNQKIVVHCAMGMERSVLAVVWFMASKWRMQLHQALKHVQTKRPIALNRLDWISL